MSMITACPACHTEFEVTPDQLEAYAGQVRCGTCQHVFNAKEYLLEADEAASSSLASVSTSDKEALNAAFDNLDLSEPQSANHHSPLLQGLAQVDEAQSQLNKPNAEVGDDDLIVPPKVNLDFKPYQEDPNVIVPSFLQDIKVDARDFGQEEKSSSTLGYTLLGAILLALLGLQTAYALRTTLAAQYPATKPWLVQGCQLLGCKVDLPKNISLLTIDDADMQEHLERDGVLEFSSTLINHSKVVQAFPLVELTLTNTDDEPVMRRSFKPEEYLQESRDVTQGLQAQEEVRVKMTLSASGAVVAGFRVGLSYPN